MPDLIGKQIIHIEIGTRFSISIKTIRSIIVKV